MSHGLSAFPLTPLRDGAVDEDALARLTERAAAAGAASIGVLGSTGSYMYLDRAARERAVRAAVGAAGGVPVLAGIGAIATDQVLAHAADAQAAGAGAVLLAPVTYQALSPEELLGLFADVAAELSVPLVVYDNPGTTHADLTLDLYAEISRLPGVAAIKIPPVGPEGAHERIAAVRAAIPASVRVGISGDAVGALGLTSGCDLWFSAIGGILPEPCVRIARLAAEGREADALAASARLEPLWRLLRRHGSLRLSQAIGELLGLVEPGTLPRPVRGLRGADRDAVAAALQETGITA